jgi:hypothetical protein
LSGHEAPSNHVDDRMSNIVCRFAKTNISAISVEMGHSLYQELKEIRLSR